MGACIWPPYLVVATAYADAIRQTKAPFEGKFCELEGEDCRRPWTA